MAAPLPSLAMTDDPKTTLRQQLRARRRQEGSLELETFQPRAVFEGEKVVDIRQQVQNRARQLIEEVMIATNGCTARYLAAHGGASLRRVVRSPERWLRIVGVAKEYGETLPEEPDSKALEAFLARQHQADPVRFPDLSLVIVKLMGRGEYVVETQGGMPIGHFGLAVRDYTHSTAPNRRFPDLITSRLLKAALADQPPPYSNTELAELGLCGLYISEDHGGMGMGPVEGMVVMEELGRGIVLEPVAQALIAGGILAGYAGDPLKARVLGHVASGETLVAQLYKSMTEEQRKAVQKQIPMRRFVRPEEIAAAVFFLASAEASYITGATLKMDGGLV